MSVIKDYNLSINCWILSDDTRDNLDVMNGSIVILVLLLDCNCLYTSDKIEEGLLVLSGGAYCSKGLKHISAYDNNSI